MSEHQTWMDRWKVVPRTVALLLCITALVMCGVVCVGFIADISDGEPTTALATVMGTMVGALIGGTTAAVGFLRQG